MSRPDWCDEETWEKAVKMASEWEENPELIQHMAEDFAPALLSAKREGMIEAAEIAASRVPLWEEAEAIAAAIRQKAGDHRSGDGELIGTARQ